MLRTLPLRPFASGPVPLPTGTDAAALDRWAMEEGGVPSPVLMENAGRSAALVLHHLHPRGRVVAVVGRGNNGGDGLVLLRTLASWGREVAAVWGAGGEPDSGRLRDWAVPFLPPGEPDDAVPGHPDVVVDALLGTGLSGPPRASPAQWIRRVNRSDVPVVALDLPSGVDADGGRVPGEAVRADLTVTFGWPKLGMMLHPARGLAGRVVAVEIGYPPLPADPGRAELLTPAWAAARRPRRAPDTHKNAVGSLLLLAGSPGMAGAAVLAAGAARRAGVGLLRVASRPENREILQITLPGAIYVDASSSEALAEAARGSRAAAAGPGLGLDERAESALNLLLRESSGPLLLDADALTLVAAGRTPPLAELAASRPLLLTPHPGEMERLTGRPREEIQGDRPGAARRLAASTGAHVLLKGAPSILASPGGGLLVDGGGGSELATAGMGDVLAGSAAAFLAMGLPPPTAGGVALQAGGRAAVLAGGSPGVSPEDVVEHLPWALREEGAGDTDLPFPFVLLDQDPPR